MIYLQKITENIIKYKENNCLKYGEIAGYNKCCINEFTKVHVLDRVDYQYKARKVLSKKTEQSYIYILCKKCSKKVLNGNYDIENYYNINLRNIQINLVNCFLKQYMMKTPEDLYYLIKDKNITKKDFCYYIKYIKCLTII